MKEKKCLFFIKPRKKFLPVANKKRFFPQIVCLLYFRIIWLSFLHHPIRAGYRQKAPFYVVCQLEWDFFLIFTWWNIDLCFRFFSTSDSVLFFTCCWFRYVENFRFFFFCLVFCWVVLFSVSLENERKLSSGKWWKYGVLWFGLMDPSFMYCFCQLLRGRSLKHFFRMNWRIIDQRWNKKGCCH